MHANTEQLLSLRDGDAVSVDITAHVKTCPECRGEIARLERVRDALRALPEAEPAANLWETVAVGSLDRPTPSRFHWASALAIAASFVMGVALMTRLQQSSDDAGQIPLETTPAATVASSLPAGERSMPALQLSSRRLETLRAALPRRQGVERAATAMTIVELEDRIALVDLKLNNADALGLTIAQERILWKERVNLMQSLIQVEYALLQNPGR
jgi:hypothetical protein